MRFVRGYSKGAIYTWQSLPTKNLNIVLGLQLIVQSKKALKSRTDAEPLQWPIAKIVRNRIKNGIAYQGAIVKQIDEEMQESGVG